MDSMRAAALGKPDGNGRRTPTRRVTLVTQRSKLVTTRSSGQVKTPADYREERYARRWRKVWKSFWWGYGLVTVSALIAGATGLM